VDNRVETVNEFIKRFVNKITVMITVCVRNMLRFSRSKHRFILQLECAYCLVSKNGDHYDYEDETRCFIKPMYVKFPTGRSQPGVDFTRSRMTTKYLYRLKYVNCTNCSCNLAARDIREDNRLWI
jgi:hypothetical protein